MPAKGYKVITITEQVYAKITENMVEMNRKAGYKKFRSVSHFVEEATMGFLVNVVQKGATDPETLVKNLVEIMWDRYDILGTIMNRLISLPPEEALHRLERILGSEGLDKLKAICME